MIKQEGDKYIVYSESGKRFGEYSNEKDAKRRLSQMEMFKHMKKTAATPKLKNFFATEPSCVVHGAGTQCVTGREPSFSKKAEEILEKIAVSPKFLRKVLSKSINSLNHTGLEDFTRINESIGRMASDIVKKNMGSKSVVSKLDRVNLDVLKHESNRLGSKYSYNLMKKLKKNKDYLNPGLN